MRGCRPQWVLVVAGMAVVLAVAVAFELWPFPDRVTADNFDRIRVDMTRPDIRLIFGAPGDYRSGPITPEPRGVRKKVFDEAEFAADCVSDDEWVSDNAAIKVFYGRSGTVFAALYFEQERAGEGPLENLSWRANRLWHRWFSQHES
jgi:hypothetical protein